MYFNNNKGIRIYLHLLIIVSFINLLSACSGNSDNGTTSPKKTDTDTSQLSFNIVFEDVDADLQRLAATIDCTGLGITTVEAMVYDLDKQFLVGGGPWPCDIGQGIIDAVPVGSGHIVAVLAKDSDGQLVYRGEKTGLDVSTGSNNNAGTIQCDAFSIRLKTPENKALVPADDVELAWGTISGASEYRIVISEIQDLSDPLIEASDPTGFYTPSNLDVGKTYYWRVVAIDAYGNAGIGSQILSFSAIQKKNMLLDPRFHLTESDTDERYWWLTNYATYLEWNRFNEDGQIDAGGNPAVKITSRADGDICYLWEKNPYPEELKVRTFPIKSNDKFYVEARVYESMDSDADGPSDFGAEIWAGDENREWHSNNRVSLRPQSKGRWETVSGEITIYDRQPDAYDEWRATVTYNEWDVVKHDPNGDGNDVVYRCRTDGVSGADKEPPNGDYWVRYDTPQLGNFGIFSENGTKGYFLVDNIILSPRY